MQTEDYKTLPTDEKIQKMLEEASQIHANVNQFYDDNLPYGKHLKDVLDNVLHYGEEIFKDDKDIKEITAFAACFHDVIEDARLTYNDVLKIADKYFNLRFDSEWAADIVYALTNEKGKNRAERENDKYFEGIRKVEFAPFVKCCDRLANYNHGKKTNSSLYKKYITEMPSFIKRVKIPDYLNELPKSLIDALKDTNQ